MLTELRVSNFALIEHLHLTFPPGFVSLTGETGAGKSLLVDAIGLLLGQKGTADHIRAGADEAELEASFVIPPTSPLLDQLRTADLLRAEEREVVVRRVLLRTGRGRSYVNGRLASLQELEQFAGSLVDIHGQHEQQSLLNPTAQLEAIDQFGKLAGLREEYARAYAEWRQATRRLEEVRVQTSAIREREDLLRYQAQEIREAAIQPGEDEALKERCRRLAHAERIRSLTEQAYQLLYEGEGAVVELLGAVDRDLKDLAAIDGEAASWVAQVGQARVLLQDVAGELRRYREGVEDDPALLGQLEARLARLELLKKKYGGTIETVLERGVQLDRQIGQLEGEQGQEAALADEVRATREVASALAASLSGARRKVVTKLEGVLKKEFAALHLGKASLSVRVEPLGDSTGLGPLGVDRVQFLFSANVGETPQPLARVASGGEMSRVMLALKTVLAADDRVPVLIFDEIDTGVGGAVAKAVGARLRSLARFHQVLCVTHLPQVASQAQSQILVEKNAQGKRTVTSARRLDREAREEAIAKMLGGRAVTPTMRRAAAELLEESEEARPT